MVLTRAARVMEEALNMEFGRADRPDHATLVRIAIAIGKPIAFVENWFENKRGAQNPRLPNPLPNPGIVQQQAPLAVPVQAPLVARALPPGIIVEMGRQLVVTRYREHLHGPVLIKIVLPQPAFCYPATLITQFNQFDHNHGAISNEEERIFQKVLMIKLCCEICQSGLITVKCVGCQHGVCNDCFVGLASLNRASNVQCPVCRACQPDQFAPTNQIRY